MYAIIDNNGKQYLIEKNIKIKVEKINTNIGEEVIFKNIAAIFIGDKIELGKPFVNNYIVKGVISNHTKEKKIKILKFKRRKHHMKSKGHRQQSTEVKIKSIIKFDK